MRLAGNGHINPKFSGKKVEPIYPHPFLEIFKFVAHSLVQGKDTKTRFSTPVAGLGKGLWSEF